MTTKLHHQILW